MILLLNFIKAIIIINSFRRLIIEYVQSFYTDKSMSVKLIFIKEIITR